MSNTVFKIKQRAVGDVFREGIKNIPDLSHH